MKFRECLHRKTLIRIPSESITTICKTLYFLANSHCIDDSVLTAKYYESGKRSRKLFVIRLLKKRETWTNFLFGKPCSPAVMNSQSPNSGSMEVSLLHSQHYSSVKIRLVKMVLNTAAAEASCCFTLLNGMLHETEMYDTNNKRSLNLSEYKK